MDPNETFRMWANAVLAEDREEANEAYNNLRVWLDRGGFEPDAFDNPYTRKQFFRYNPQTGHVE